MTPRKASIHVYHGAAHRGRAVYVRATVSAESRGLSTVPDRPRRAAAGIGPARLSRARSVSSSAGAVSAPTRAIPSPIRRIPPLRAISWLWAVSPISGAAAAAVSQGPLDHLRRDRRGRARGVRGSRYLYRCDGWWHHSQRSRRCHHHRFVLYRGGDAAVHERL